MTEAKTNCAQVQSFLLIKSFTSGIYMPTRLCQVPISWKTKPTGAWGYKLNTELLLFDLAVNWKITPGKPLVSNAEGFLLRPDSLP